MLHSGSCLGIFLASLVSVVWTMPFALLEIGHVIPVAGLVDGQLSLSLFLFSCDTSVNVLIFQVKTLLLNFLES